MLQVGGSVTWVLVFRVRIRSERTKTMAVPGKEVKWRFGFSMHADRPKDKALRWQCVEPMAIRGFEPTNTLMGRL